MSQSPCVDLGNVYKRTQMRWIVSVGVIHSAGLWLYVTRWGLKWSRVEWNAARWRWRKECRIFFQKCPVVKLWRVLYYFQEERLNSLSFDFFPPCLHPSVFLLFLLHFGHFGTRWRPKTVNWYISTLTQSPSDGAVIASGNLGENVTITHISTGKVDMEGPQCICGAHGNLK